MSQENSSRTRFLSAEQFSRLGNKLTAIMQAYYLKNPYRVYMPVPDLISHFAAFADKQVYDALVENLIN